MNTKKTLVAVIAAMLVAASLSCFAKGNVVTQWTGKDGGHTYLFTFYSDKIVELIETYEDGSSDKFEGTYSGDTTKDGEISLVFDGDTYLFFDGDTYTADIIGDLLDIDGEGLFTKVK